MAHHLFSFTTTRNAATLSAEQRRRFHVFIRDEDRSATHYWSNLVRGTSTILLRTIRERASNAPDLPRLDELSEQFRPYLDLYRDAHSEARRASFAGTVALIRDAGQRPLQRAERVLLWDLLAHHLWVFPDKDIVDAVRAIFVGGQMIELVRLLDDADGVTDEQLEADARRASEARIVLPLQVVNQRGQTPRPAVSRQQQNMLETAHDRLLEADELDGLEAAWTEIETLALEVSTQARAEADEERERAEGELLTALSTRLSADAVETILPMLRHGMTQVIRPAPVDFARTISARTSPRTARLVQQHTQGLATQSPQALLDSLEAEIADRETGYNDEITNVEQSTFLAFGAELSIEVVIPKGLSIFKVQRPPEGGFHLYMTYHHGGTLPPIGAIGGTIEAGGTSHPVREEEVPHAVANFQTFRLTEQPILSSSFDLDLTFQSAAADAAPVSLDSFRLFSSAPVFRMLDLDPFDAPAEPPKPLFGVNRLGVIDYRRVEEELHCHVLGAMSRVENVVASELKERVSRTMSLIESEQMETQEVSSEQLSDTATTERFEIASQVSEVLREQAGYTFDTGVAVHAELPGKSTLDTNASFNYNSQSSREDSTSEAIRTAKEVTRRAQEKLLQKAKSSRRSLSRREYEVITKHVYDNRQNPDHVVAVLHFIDKIMEYRLVNYGQLNVLEFDLAEPARCFIHAQQTQQEKDSVLPYRPKKPSKLGLNGPASITRRNWRRLAAAYKADVDPPPPASMTFSRTYADSAMTSETEETSVNIHRKVAYNDIEVPTDYRAVRYWTEADARFEAPGDPVSGTPGAIDRGGYLRVSVGGDEFRSQTDPPEEGFPLAALSGTVGVAVSCSGVYDFAVTVRVKCKLRAGVFRAWQMETHAALMGAYRELRDAYREARREYLEEEADTDLNPRFKKRHMERELKRLCIEMLTRPFGLDFSRDHYDPPTDENSCHRLRQGAALDRHAELVRFFELAFWWEIISYAFYPYFYADQKTWAAKLTMEATHSPLFASFLSAGMGRAMLPIRPGYEELVMCYMQTGEICFASGIVVDTDNDLYLSIADEIIQRRAVEEVIEETWQETLPTNHTILQSAAAALNAEGLPCANGNDGLGMGSSLLSPVLPTPGGDAS